MSASDEMVKRVAESLGVNQYQMPKVRARAAIKVLQKPTQEMIEAGDRVLADYVGGSEEVFVAMINELLKTEGQS